MSATCATLLPLTRADRNDQARGGAALARRMTGEWRPERPAFGSTICLRIRGVAERGIEVEGEAQCAFAHTCSATRRLHDAEE